MPTNTSPRRGNRSPQRRPATKATAAAATESNYSTDDDTKKVAKRLYGFGDTVCHCCGISNKQIGGFLLQCAACKQAYYCGVACFNQHLPKHKKFCDTAALEKGPKGAMTQIVSFSTHGNGSNAGTESNAVAPAASGPKTKYIDTSCSESETEAESVAGPPAPSRPPIVAPTTPSSPSRTATKAKAAPVVAPLVAAPSSPKKAAAAVVVPSSPKKGKAAVTAPSSPKKAAAATAPVTSVGTAGAGTGAVKTKYIDASCSESETETESMAENRRRRRNGANQRRRGGRRPTAPAPTEPQSESQTQTPIDESSLVQGQSSGLPSAAALQKLVSTSSSTRGNSPSQNKEAPKPMPKKSAAAAILARRSSHDSSDRPANAVVLKKLNSCYGYGSGSESVLSDSNDEAEEEEWYEETWHDDEDNEEYTESADGDEEDYEDEGGNDNGDDGEDEWEEQTVETNGASTIATTPSVSISLNSAVLASATAGAIVIPPRPMPPPPSSMLDINPTSSRVKTTFVDTSCSESETETESMADKRRHRQQNRRRGNKRNTTSAADVPVVADTHVKHPSSPAETPKQPESKPVAPVITSKPPLNRANSCTSSDTESTEVTRNDARATRTLPYAQFRVDHDEPGNRYASHVSVDGATTHASHDTDSMTNLDVLSGVSDDEDYHGRRRFVAAPYVPSVVIPNSTDTDDDDSRTAQSDDDTTETVEYDIEHSRLCRGGGNLLGFNDKGANGEPGVVLKPLPRAQANGPRETSEQPHSSPRSIRNGVGTTQGLNRCNNNQDHHEGSPKRQLVVGDEMVDIEESRQLSGGGHLHRNGIGGPSNEKVNLRATSRSSNGEMEAEPTSEPQSDYDEEMVSATDSDDEDEISVSEYTYSEYDTIEGSETPDMDRVGRLDGVHKLQRRHSIDSAEDVDVVISRLRYGGGLTEAPGRSKHKRRHSESVSLRPTSREMRTYPWTTPEWAVHRLRKMALKRHESIRPIPRNGNELSNPHGESVVVHRKNTGYQNGLSRPTQAAGQRKPNIEWEKPKWIESPLLAIIPREKKIEPNSKAAVAKSAEELSPEWVKKKGVLRATPNGRKLQRMGTFRDELKKERIGKHKEKGGVMCGDSVSCSDASAVPDIVKRAALLPKFK